MKLVMSEGVTREEVSKAEMAEEEDDDIVCLVSGGGGSAACEV